MTGDYTTEQFKRDVADYTSVIEQKLRYLKLVGVAAKDRDDKNIDPELHTIFVALRVALHASPLQRRGQDAQGTIIDILERHPGVKDHHMVLLGGPGSGKSTALRHLAWSHAAAYHWKFSDALLLSSSQVPLVPVSIELHLWPRAVLFIIWEIRPEVKEEADVSAGWISAAQFCPSDSLILHAGFYSTLRVYLPTPGLLLSFFSSNIPLLARMVVLVCISDTLSCGSIGGQNPAFPIPRAIVGHSALQSD